VETVGVEIEQTAYKKCEAKANDLKVKVSYSQIHVGKVLLPIPTFQNIDFVIPKKFTDSVGLEDIPLKSFLPQTKKRKEIQIQSFYSISRMHFKKPRFLLLQHFKTRGRVFSNQGRMAHISRSQYYFYFIMFLGSKQYRSKVRLPCSYLVLSVGGNFVIF
jgi:hypothetical protein